MPHRKLLLVVLGAAALASAAVFIGLQSAGTVAVLPSGFVEVAVVPRTNPVTTAAMSVAEKKHAARPPVQAVPESDATPETANALESAGMPQHTSESVQPASAGASTVMPAPQPAPSNPPPATAPAPQPQPASQPQPALSNPPPAAQSAPASQPAPAPQPQPAPQATNQSVCVGKININTASAAELDAITHVGPVIAERIIAARPFTSVQELDAKVKGIGPKYLADIIAQGKACVR